MEEVTIRKDELERLRHQSHILRSIQSVAEIGWWRVDFDLREFTCSDHLAKLFRFGHLPVTFEDFRALIHPDHKQRVIRSFTAFPEAGFYDERFPVMTGMGYIWIHSKLGARMIARDGHWIAEGFMQHIEMSDAVLSQEDAAQIRIKELLGRHSSVSRSLLTLLRSPDTDDAINEILENLLQQFDGDRVYIFEFDRARGIQSCTYEVTRGRVEAQRDMLQDLPIDQSPWWIERIMNRIPIILNDLDMLPPEADDIRQLLRQQDIQSLMVVPMVARNDVWGYLGIDMVQQPKLWNWVDQQWFFSIANILSVCMEMRQSELTALREKEYLLNLYMHMPMGYARTQIVYEKGHAVDYRFVEVNPAFERISGMPADRIVGKLASEAGVTRDDTTLQNLDKISRDNRTVANRRLCGEGRHFDSILYSPDPGYCTILVNEVTEQVRSIEAVQRSEEMFQSIYNNVPVGIEFYDRNGCMIDMNEMNMKIFGLRDKEKMIGSSLFDNPNLSEHQKEMLRNGENIENQTVYDFDLAKSFADTSCSGLKDLLVKGKVLFNAEHEVENYLFIVVDNTESLQANHRLKEFEFLFNYVAEFAEIGLCQWHPYTMEVTGSDQWYANLGQPVRTLNRLEEAYTKIHPDDFERLQSFFRDAIARKTDNYRAEVRVADEEGWRWLRCNYRVKETGEGPENLVIMGLNIDINELKKTEVRLIEAKTRAEEADRLKSAFLANMSHEIRTPLNAIVGFSNLLADTADQEEKSEYVSIIQKNNEHLLQLISDILDLSKIEAGVLEMTSGRFNVNDLCEEVVKSCRTNPALAVDLLFEPSVPHCTLFSDKSRLSQVLSNFIGNAIKFTSEGSIRLGYEIRDRQIEFYVQDTGTGISKEQLHTIFDRFVKLNRFVQGTGLGLAISKSIIEKLGGRIGADSEPGKGTRFWFVLPYESEPEQISGKPETDGKPEAVSKYASGRDEKPLILVAEDTDSNYLLVSTILKKDYRVVRASDGVEAVERFFELSPDAVLMDLRMPNMDGLEATRRIRGRDRSTPIIALTAFAYDSDREKAAAAGCTDFMTKPISPVVLKERLARLF